MAYTNTNNASVPQGFSVYQPSIGAPLEFLPALGTKMLDDLLNAYVPGPSTMQQKRAQVSLEFLNHFQQTNQGFKYFVVSDAAVANAESPSLMPSPAQGSSSFTVSPVASDWDWSSVNSGTPGSSSRSGSSRKATANSRHQTAADFSHMPGMKIMTKDGLDVTNSATRGSKTKEQRDHAHLMRIIKACDSCRKKKIRCDPSHKKRAAAAAPQPVAKASKKARVAAPAVSKKQPVAAPPAQLNANTVPPPAPSLDLESFPAFESVDDLAMPMEMSESWEEFVHFPQDMDTDYDFFFDPEGFLTPSISDASPSSSAEAMSKSISPTSFTSHVVSEVGGSQMSTSDVFATGELHNVDAPQLPYLDVVGGSNNYTDFNLYSPASSFSEDERMLSVASSTPSTSADGASLVRSPPDRPHAPRGEDQMSNAVEESGAVSLDGQLRWAGDEDIWADGTGSVEFSSWTGVSSDVSSDGALATNDAINTEPLLETAITDFHGQDQPLIRAQTVNAVDRSHLHDQSAMMAGSTVLSTTRPAATLALNGLVSESLSHVQMGTANVQNNVLQSTRLSTDNLLRTTDAASSINAVGSEQTLQMATSSSTVESLVQATTSHTSESSSVDTPSSSRSPGMDAVEGILRSSMPAAINDQVELGQNIPGDTVLWSLQTRTSNGVSEVSAYAGRAGVAAPVGTRRPTSGVDSQIDDHMPVDGEPPSANLTVARNRSVGWGSQYIDRAMLALSALCQHRGDATSASSSTLHDSPERLTGTLASPSCAIAALSVYLSMLLIAGAFGFSSWVASAAMAIGLHSFRVLTDEAPQGASSTAHGLLRRIRSGGLSCKRSEPCARSTTSARLPPPALI